MTITITPGISAPLVVRFVLDSTLSYPCEGDLDGRLACWWRGDGHWAVAWCDRACAGVACVAPLDDGPHAGMRCLYWLEILPPFQSRGIGRALLRWAVQQSGEVPLLIASTPAAAPFYRHCVRALTELTPTIFVLKGGATTSHTGSTPNRAIAYHRALGSTPIVAQTPALKEHSQ
jgi:GNAT superfamily N-acetyltransferase